MAKVKLMDQLGYSLGEPDVPEPLPRVIVWGEEFFLANEEDAVADVENPRYRQAIQRAELTTQRRRIVAYVRAFYRCGS